MKKLFISLLLLISSICATSQGLLFSFSGSVVDTMYAGDLYGCDSSYYEYIIDINNYQVPDSITVFSPNWDLLVSMPYVPCSETFLQPWNICKEGYIEYDNGTFIFNSPVPAGFKFGMAPPIRGKSRIKLLVPYKYIAIEYYGNQNFENTVSDIYIHDVVEYKQTVTIDTLLYQCETPPKDLINDCIDTNYVVDYRPLFIPDTVYLCDYSTSPPFIDEPHAWFQGDSLIQDSLINSEDLTLVYYHDQCNDTVTVPVIYEPNPSPDTTLFIEFNDDIGSYQLVEIDGEYYMTLKTGHCDYLVKVELIRLKHGEVYIPNAFSPNGDGVNDVWGLYYSDYVKEVKKLLIFDRWGGLVHKDTKWDGAGAPEGVYVYLVVIENAFGEIEIYKGDITLIR